MLVGIFNRVISSCCNRLPPLTLTLTLTLVGLGSARAERGGGGGIRAYLALVWGPDLRVPEGSFRRSRVLCEVENVAWRLLSATDAPRHILC